ncbi:MAG: RtcB family protein [Oscillospiraceae bacterium]|nr:RtcB family protein [Oscillospiraceae bacterium]
MIELNGKYNTAKVFTDIIDEASISQIIELCSQEFTIGEKIRMMPDVHAGMGCVIGTTMTITDKIVPNLVGVDIGCGMETVRIKERNIELMQLDKLIYNKIPSGFAVREKPHKFAQNIDICSLRCADKIDLRKAERSLGTLGGGNHFIEADRGEKGLYIVIHSGSRHLGLEVAKYYQQKGYEQLCSAGKDEVNSLIASLKAQGRDKEIRRELKKLESTKRVSVPKHLAYVNGKLFDDYIHDMKIVQQYAALNRKAMMDEIVRGLKLTVEEQFTTIHNYIDTDNMILRKGAVSAQAGEQLIIPINMRDGSLICIGKGNPDWNCSAPHGAGRLMSRREAKESFTVSRFKKEMEGIYSTSIGKGTLDECPMAYKSIDDIAGNIGDTADISDIIKPVYNFKAGVEIT